MSRRLWIIWLMLALLPLRGWAAAGMAMPVVVVEASAHATRQATDGSVAAMPPCHEAGGDLAGSAGHDCHLCDLCHAAAADLAGIALPMTPRPDPSPRPALARDTGRHAVGGLERPPRTLLV